MNGDEETGNEGITLLVKTSGIGAVDSGIARIHESYLEELGDEAPRQVIVRSDDKETVINLVADRMVKKGTIILRSGDMETLKVEDGHTVELLPYKSFREELKENWQRFKEKFSGKEEEE